MAISCGKAARRKWGTRFAAKRAKKHKAHDFGTPEQEKEQYRAMKAARKKRR